MGQMILMQLALSRVDQGEGLRVRMSGGDLKKDSIKRKVLRDSAMPLSSPKLHCNDFSSILFLWSRLLGRSACHSTHGPLSAYN